VSPRGLASVALSAVAVGALIGGASFTAGVHSTRSDVPEACRDAVRILASYNRATTDDDRARLFNDLGHARYACTDPGLQLDSPVVETGKTSGFHTSH
jgi:hypothetical protein